MRGTDQKFRVAIFGKSHEAWPVAALLAKELPARYQLTVVEDDTRAAPAALTLRWQNRFHERLGLDAGELIRQCNGTVGLGTELIGWQGDGSSFFIAASGKLPHIEGVDLHQVMLRAAYMTGEEDRFAYLFQPFRFAARAAEAGKLTLPSEAVNSPAEMLGPTIQLDRANYIGLLKSRSDERVSLISGRPAEVTIDSTSGMIDSVKIAAGKTVIADLFIDASGALSHLFPAKSGDTITSLAEQIPFNRIAGCVDDMPDISGHAQTRSRAISGGLVIETPLATGGISELIFSSDTMDENDVLTLIGEGSEIANFEPGYSENPWHGNLLRLGNAAGNLGPFYSADTLLLHEQAMLLADHAPVGKDMKAEAEAYNHLQMGALDEIRDFLLLPLSSNGWDEALWKRAREATTPESLERRIDQFENRARFSPYENELFDEQTWIETFIGLASAPRRYDPMAEKLDMGQVQRTLKNLVDEFNRTLGSMPSHFDFMQEFGN